MQTFSVPDSLIVARRLSDAAEGSGRSVLGAGDVQAAAMSKAHTAPIATRNFLDAEALEVELIARQSIGSREEAQGKSSGSPLWYIESGCWQFTIVKTASRLLALVWRT